MTGAVKTDSAPIKIGDVDTGVTIEVDRKVLKAALESDKILVVGWDVAISEDGPLVIEGNRRPGFDLVQVLDGYFDQPSHHVNINVFGMEKLLDAMEHPEKEEYANFTIRVSGYAVKFIDLTREQQLDVISRTFHEAF